MLRLLPPAAQGPANVCVGTVLRPSLWQV